MRPIGPEVQIAVFARAPKPGAVKTRLIPLLGAEDAAALHKRLVLQTLHTACPDLETYLYCAPTADDPFFEACRLRYGVTLRDQCAGDLGTRMLRACSERTDGGRPVILIGTDCPVLARTHLRAAHDALAGGTDAVFIPAEDGGYALIGVSRAEPRLFEDMPWGTGAVMTRTRSRLRELGWRWCELDTLWDVDRPDDYRRLRVENRLDALPL